MDNLIFSLNSTMPIFLLMVLGYVFKKINLVDDAFAGKLNNFVFKVSLPVLVFNNLATVNFREAWDFGFVMYCFFATVISIAIAFAISQLIKEKPLRGEFIQSSYRSSAALLGLAFIQNIYGTSGLGPLMIIGSVPLYNICAVTVLAFYSPQNAEEKISKEQIKKTLIGILKNPIIDGIFIGLIWSYFSIPYPSILAKTVSSIGATATPIGLIAMGASFDFGKAKNVGAFAVISTFIKLIGYGLIFMPVAIALGYRNEQLIAVLVMLCSATTVSCFVMAKNMGHEGTLSSAVIMLTTLFSAFTLTGWLYFLKSFGVI